SGHAASRSPTTTGVRSVQSSTTYFPSSFKRRTTNIGPSSSELQSRILRSLIAVRDAVPLEDPVGHEAVGGVGVHAQARRVDGSGHEGLAGAQRHRRWCGSWDGARAEAQED